MVVSELLERDMLRLQRRTGLGFVGELHATKSAWLRLCRYVRDQKSQAVNIANSLFR